MFHDLLTSLDIMTTTILTGATYTRSQHIFEILR